MIILPTRKRLTRRRNELYQQLIAISQHASVSQVEGIMRKVHCINLKLRTYFQRDEHEPVQIFEDEYSA